MNKLKYKPLLNIRQKITQTPYVILNFSDFRLPARLKSV